MWAYYNGSGCYYYNGWGRVPRSQAKKPDQKLSFKQRQKNSMSALPTNFFLRLFVTRPEKGRKTFSGLLFIDQRWVAPSALPLLGCVTSVKRHKSVHKTCQKTNKTSNLASFLQKMNCTDLKNTLIFLPGHLEVIWFHHHVQQCRFYIHEFFQLPKRLINHSSVSIFKETNKISAFSLTNWKKVGTSEILKLLVLIGYRRTFLKSSNNPKMRAINSFIKFKLKDS
jgi:hypothetical protein